MKFFPEDFCFFRKRTKEPESEPEIKPKLKPEIEMVWRLRIYEVGHDYPIIYTNVNIQPLWKIYYWFLVKNSERYNIPYTNGSRIVLRSNIVSMSLEKGAKENRFDDKVVGGKKPNFFKMSCG